MKKVKVKKTGKPFTEIADRVMKSWSMNDQNPHFVVIIGFSKSGVMHGMAGNTRLLDPLHVVGFAKVADHTMRELIKAKNQSLNVSKGS